MKQQRREEAQKRRSQNRKTQWKEDPGARKGRERDRGKDGDRDREKRRYM